MPIFTDIKKLLITTKRQIIFLLITIIPLNDCMREVSFARVLDMTTSGRIIDII